MDALPPLDSSTHDGSADDSAHHPSARRIALIALSSSRSSFAVSVEPRVSVLHKWARPSMDRIDPSSAPEDDDDGRMTTVSSHYASTYASSYLSTSTYRVGGGSAVSSATASEPSLPYLPCLSWGWALVSGGGGSVTPILARAWGQSLQLLRAAYPPFDPDADDGEGGAVHWPAFGVHDELETESPVVALSWLGKRSLVYLTLANEFAVVDTVIMTMQERLDFSGMSLVYAEFSLSRGAGASPRRPEACTTFMNSMRSCDTRLLVLCRGEVKQVTILGMKQQVRSELARLFRTLFCLTFGRANYVVFSFLFRSCRSRRAVNGSRRLPWRWIITRAPWRAKRTNNGPRRQARLATSARWTRRC